jgi:hypothetical protein
MDELWSYDLPNDYAPPTAESLALANSGPIDFGSVFSGLKGLGSGAIDFTKSLAGTYQGLQVNQLQIQQGQTAIDLAKANAANNQKISLLQSQYAARMGIMMPTDASTLYGSGNNINQTLANMQRSMGNAIAGAGGNTMLYLTIAGLVLAYMQYAKR